MVPYYSQILSFVLVANIQNLSLSLQTFARKNKHIYRNDVGSYRFMYDSCMIFSPTYIVKLRINTGDLRNSCRYV